MTFLRDNFLLIALTSLLLSCQRREEGLRYIKVMTIGEADTITAFNKGFRLDFYLYYQPAKREAVMRVLESIDPDTIMTYQGKFEEADIADTLAMATKVLKRFANGPLPIPKEWEGVMYCGPVYYTEFLDERGVHFHIISMHDNDTLKMLENYLGRTFRKNNWQPRIISNSAVNDSGEMVNVLRGTGEYQEMITPFIPPKCDSTVDMGKLYGNWRTEGDRYSGSYSLETIDSSGSWAFDRVRPDTVRRIMVGKILSVKPDGTIRVKTTEVVEIKVLVLTDHCFRYKLKDRDREYELYRMK